MSLVLRGPDIHHARVKNASRLPVPTALPEQAFTRLPHCPCPHGVLGIQHVPNQVRIQHGAAVWKQGQRDIGVQGQKLIGPTVPLLILELKPVTACTSGWGRLIKLHPQGAAHGAGLTAGFSIAIKPPHDLLINGGACKQNQRKYPSPFHGGKIAPRQMHSPCNDGPMRPEAACDLPQYCGV